MRTSFIFICSAMALAGAAPAQAGGGGAETVVLDDKVVGQYIAGLKAGKAEREAAKN